MVLDCIVPLFCCTSVSDLLDYIIPDEVRDAQKKQVRAKVKIFNNSEVLTCTFNVCCYILRTIIIKTQVKAKVGQNGVTDD